MSPSVSACPTKSMFCSTAPPPPPHCGKTPISQNTIFKCNYCASDRFLFLAGFPDKFGSNALRHLLEFKKSARLALTYFVFYNFLLFQQLFFFWCFFKYFTFALMFISETFFKILILKIICHVFADFSADNVFFDFWSETQILAGSLISSRKSWKCINGGC